MASASLVAQRPPASHADEASPAPWYETAIVGMEVGPTGAQFGYSDPTDPQYCRHWDGREIVQRCVDAQAEYLVLWLRDGDFAYYDSQLLTKAPGLGDRDPLREALQEAKRHDLPIISYCVVQQGGNYLQAHPEWQMRGADGAALGRFCFNSGYLEAMKHIVAEQLAYGLTGFHIDMLDQGFGPPLGCWCETCQKQFQQRYGHAMPSGATWDDDWEDMLEFRYRTSEQFEQELTQHIKSIDPRATVDFNYHGNPPFSYEVGQRPVQHAGSGDFVTGETGVWGFSALGVGLNAEFYRAATPGEPFQVAMQRGVRMYHDQTTRPLHDLRWEMLALLAHGAFVTMIDKTAMDGRLDPQAYKRMGRVLTEARRKREHFGHRPLREVGLYFSSRTRDWMAREEPSDYFLSFYGAHRACALEHLQFGVLLDENATLETLQQYPVVCLPNVGILSALEVKLLRSYVEEGGRLLVTGHTGQFDQRGRPLERSPLEELLGAQVVRRLASRDNWISLSNSERVGPSAGRRLFAEIPLDWPFLVSGPATVYEPTTALALGELLAPHRTVRQQEGRMGEEWPMSPDQAVGPALLIHEVGKGKVVTCAGSPDYATASEHAVVEARRLFRNACEHLLHPRRLEISAPSNVEAVVTDDPEERKLRVHFLAYNPTPRSTPAKNRPYVLPGLIEDEPIFRAQLQLAMPIRDAKALDSDTVLQWQGDSAVATIEEIHEVLTLEY